MDRYSALVEDEEFESLKKMMDEAERKDAIAQKLDSVTKLQVDGWMCKNITITRATGHLSPSSHSFSSLQVTAWHCPQCARFSHSFDQACK